MLFDKIFSGGNSSKDMHSNQYAVGSVSKRTFSERKRVEQNRNRIASYRHSKLGFSSVPRDQPSSPQSATNVETDNIKQSPSQPERPTPPQQAFREPPTRGFNPYA